MQSMEEGAKKAEAQAAWKILNLAFESNSFAVALMAVKKFGFDARSDEGEPALNMAARRRKFNAVLALTSRGADPDEADGLGRVALMAALAGSDPAARLQIIKNLLSAGADPNARTPNHKTVAMEAAQAGDAACLRELAAAGADLNALDDQGLNAALIAAGARHWEALGALARLGACFDGVDPQGRSVEDLIQGARMDPSDWSAVEGRLLGMAARRGSAPSKVRL
jgi:ankyrin repeat protein